MYNKIYIIGPVGSGKTTLARFLSNKYHIDYYELDKVVFDDGRARILEKNVFKDDDGFGGTHEYEHTRARDILVLLDTVFRDLEI